MMASFITLRDKLQKELRKWPDHRKHERIPGMDLTWWELAKHLVKDKKNRRKLRPYLEKAVEAGVIRLNHKEVKKLGR
jgi:hypothetical protein